MATLSIGVSGSAIVTGTKTYTLDDTAIQTVLDWAKVAFNREIQAAFNPSHAPGFVPTNQQILLAWIQSWIEGTKDGVQRFKTVPAVVPAPIVIV